MVVLGYSGEVGYEVVKLPDGYLFVKGEKGGEVVIRNHHIRAPRSERRALLPAASRKTRGLKTLFLLKSHRCRRMIMVGNTLIPLRWCRVTLKRCQVTCRVMPPAPQ